MKENCIDLSLQYSTLRTLYLALSENQRGQNHFRSIGGLEVLLDGLGIPSNNAIILKDASSTDTGRYLFYSNAHLCVVCFFIFRVCHFLMLS